MTNNFAIMRIEKIKSVSRAGDRLRHNRRLIPCVTATPGVKNARVILNEQMQKDNREKCKELLDSLLKYNVTTEYYQCERYDDHDAYIAPWMPNASANGRVLDMLFDYYGKRRLK